MNRRHSTCTLGPAAFGRPGPAFWWLGLAFALGGCLGGQTGTEAGGTGTAGENTDVCVAESTALAAAEPSPLGFAADSVVSAVSGARSAPLKWSEAPAELDFGPEQGDSSLTLSVSVDRSSARFVHWVPDASRRDLVGCAPDEVQLAAQISFATAGGAFAETFPAVLHATSGSAARITLSLPLAALSGAFHVSPAAGLRTSAVVLDAEISAQGTSGTLRGQLEQTLGNVASVRFFTYACWPAGDPACPSP